MKIDSSELMVELERLLANNKFTGFNAVAYSFAVLAFARFVRSKETEAALDREDDVAGGLNECGMHYTQARVL